MQLPACTLRVRVCVDIRFSRRVGIFQPQTLIPAWRGTSSWKKWLTKGQQGGRILYATDAIKFDARKCSSENALAWETFAPPLPFVLMNSPRLPRNTLARSLPYTSVGLEHLVNFYPKPLHRQPPFLAKARGGKRRSGPILRRPRTQERICPAGFGHWSG